MQLHLVRRDPSTRTLAWRLRSQGFDHRARQGADAAGWMADTSADGSWPERRRPGRGAGPGTFSSAVSSHLNVPNGMVGTERTRYRAVVDKYMTGECTAAIAPICRAVAAKLVAEISRGAPVDVVGGLAKPCR